MAKKSLVFWGIGLVAVGLVAGLALTAWFEQARPVQAIDSNSSLPSIQSAALFGGPTALALPSFADLAKRVGPAVVNISTTKVIKRQPMPGVPGRPGMQDPFEDFFENFLQQPSQRPMRSLGSGFIINSDGYILTNNHVVEKADEVQVQLTDKRKLEAKVIGTDPKTDLAIIKITGKDLPSVLLGNSDELQVGDWVVAVGNPFGLEHTVTAGIVSAKGRIIGAGPYDDFIQTDASINPGNSGGPLFNIKGEVVGVNSAIVASGQGIGFAIPINMAKDLVPQLIKSGKVTRAWLGVGIQEITPELAESFGLKDAKGGLVANIFPGSPADKAGLKPGDVVIRFNGRTISESHELPAMVARLPIGSEAEMTILREGKEKTFKIKLVEMEEGEKQAMKGSTTSGELGLAVRDMTPEEMGEAGVKSGILVVGVEPGGPADFAGVMRGDILLSLNNTPLSKAGEFRDASSKIAKGKVVRLHIKRDDQTIFLAFTK